MAIFGQSHSAAIGCVVDGLPAGEEIDLAEIGRFMERRAPGRNIYSTTRREGDIPEIVSGATESGEGKLTTCGAPLCAIIRNTDCRSKDYDNLRDMPRPAHADLTAQIKFGGWQDVRGGGHFSGRLTAPLCVAGSICRQILHRRGIDIHAHIRSIGDVADEPFDTLSPARQIASLESNGFPVIDASQGERMQKLIEQCRMEQDSIGGIVECIATGVPAGAGNPMFDGVENLLAKALFGIPAVKGVEFGAGFAVGQMRGSQNNDPFTMRDGHVETTTNNHGGILGGITSGMPIVMRAAFKPTPSIAKEQHSVSLSGACDATLRIEGRHDPCIVPRAVAVVEAVAATVILDILITDNKLG